MLKIGITGGIGSGKSTVARIFALMGIPVYDADSAAKQLMNNNDILINQLKTLFGNSIYNSKGNLNPKELAAIIFNDDVALKKVNNAVHPIVAKDFEDWACNIVNVPYLLKESAILFEANADKGLDYNIAVSAPLSLCIKRAIKRDGISENQIRNIASKQFDNTEKIKRADFVIYNDEMHLVIPQVLTLHKFLTAKSNDN